MDVNSIQSTGLNSLSSQSLGAEQLNQSQFIPATTEDIEKSSSYSLKIQNGVKRSDTVNYLSELNKDVSKLKVEENILNKQKDILSEIKTVTVDAMGTQLTADGKVEVKNQLQSLLNQFNTTSVESKNTQLNEVKPDDLYSDVNSVERGNNFDIGVSSTTFIGADLSYLIDKTDFDPKKLGNELLKVDAGLAKLEEFIKNNSETQKDILKSGQEYIKNEITKSENEFVKSQINNIGKDSNDFAKTNITAQQGYLVASQANIIQEQSYRLLA